MMDKSKDPNTRDATRVREMAEEGQGLKKAAAPLAQPAAPRIMAKHVVAAGETLSHLSLKYYKTATRWREIYEANKAVIGDDPGKLKVGQELIIPEG